MNETDGKFNILIVDDTAKNIQVVANILNEHGGFQMAFARNGKAALANVKTAKFDLILLDIMMPEMDGYETCQHLKADPETADIPVIFLTAKTETESIVKGFELGGVDYVTKPFNSSELIARVRTHSELRRARAELKQSEQRLKGANQKLDLANRFIRKTFGRYLSDDIVDAILETPDGLKLGGEKRQITIMMTDLRGFTAISERLPAEDVVNIINTYFEVMTDIIFRYSGTIDGFIGDAILAVFGAPVLREDDALRAVACALEMQLAMEQVNARNRSAGYPDISMGIGLNTGDAVVGNIGSDKRVQYSVIGRTVNLTSRIESYTVGGQVLISQSTLDACGDILRIDDQTEVKPKGVTDALIVYEIGGIGGEFDIFLPEKKAVELTKLRTPLPIRFEILEGKQSCDIVHDGTIISLKDTVAEIMTQRKCRDLTNLKISVSDAGNHEIIDLYAKVTGQLSENPSIFRVRFTFVPHEAEAFFKKVLKEE